MLVVFICVHTSRVLLVLNSTVAARVQAASTHKPEIITIVDADFLSVADATCGYNHYCRSPSICNHRKPGRGSARVVDKPHHPAHVLGINGDPNWVGWNFRSLSHHETIPVVARSVYSNRADVFQFTQVLANYFTVLNVLACNDCQRPREHISCQKNLVGLFNSVPAVTTVSQHLTLQKICISEFRQVPTRHGDENVHQPKCCTRGNTDPSELNWLRS